MEKTIDSFLRLNKKKKKTKKKLLAHQCDNTNYWLSSRFKNYLSRTVQNKYPRTGPFGVLCFLTHVNNYQPFLNKGFPLSVINSIWFSWMMFPVLYLDSSPWLELAMGKLLGFSFTIHLITCSRLYIISYTILRPC